MTNLSEHARQRRHRGTLAVGVIVVIGLGLASRSPVLALPPFLAKYAGDALWALMIFLGMAFLLPTRRTMTLAILAALVCSAVEFGQLCRAPWLVAIRRTRLGLLMLGDTFAWADLAAYVVGVAVGVCLEWAIRSFASRRKNHADLAAGRDFQIIPS